MPNPESRIQPPPRVLAVASYGGPALAEVFVALIGPGPKGRDLSTVEFVETRADLGEAEELHRVGWGLQVPEGAEPFMPCSGFLPSQVKAGWSGWRVPHVIHAASIHIAGPIAARFEEGERLIDPAVVVAGGGMHQYLLRPGGVGGGLRLTRMEFRGGPDDGNGGTDVRELGSIEGRPV